MVRVDIRLDADLINSRISFMKNTKYRKLIDLHIKGYKNTEIANKLGRSTNWVKSAKYQALKELKKILTEEGII